MTRGYEIALSLVAIAGALGIWAAAMHLVAK